MAVKRSAPSGSTTGQPAPEPFRYRDWGSMATIGRSAAVAEIGGSHLTGFVAWLLRGSCTSPT